MEEAGIVRVERKYKAPARICVCGAPDRHAEIDGSAEPALGNRSDKKRGSCSTDSDSDCTDLKQSVQSESVDLDSPDLMDLRGRLESLAFRGVSWALKTFDPKVLGETLTTVEALARDGLSYNPGGLVNSALRGKVVLFRPQETPKQKPDTDTGDTVSGAETTAEKLRAYLSEMERYPADYGKQCVPDTYHPEEPEDIVDPAVGVEKLKAGLKARKVA